MNTIVYDATHTVQEWNFPGGAHLQLYVSAGKRACLRLQDDEGVLYFFQEYPWDSIEHARKHAEGIASFGLSIVSGIEGRMVA